MTQLSPSLRLALAELGPTLTPQLVEGTRSLFAPISARPDPSFCRVERDLAYAPHERHKLDVYIPTASGENRPVVVYVHGGGFSMGSKGAPDEPFFNNIGAWAARTGFLGVTINYRRGHAPLAGACMMSGIYDLVRHDRMPFEDGYYGSDLSRTREQSTLVPLIDQSVPCLFSVSELDPPPFQRQAGHLVDRSLAVFSRWPKLLYLLGHNHLSPAYHLGGEGDEVGGVLATFVKELEPYASEARIR